MSKKMRTVVSLLAVLSLTALIFFAMNFSSFTRNRNSQSEQIPETKIPDFDRLLTEGSIAELIDYASSHQASDSRSLPDQLANLKKQFAIADRIIEIESQADEPVGLLTAQVVKIDAIMELDRLHQKHQLKSEFVERQIEDYVIPMQSNSNSKVAEEAHVCMSLSLCQKYLNSPNAENFQQMRLQLLKSVGFALESQPAIQRLVVISKMVDPAASSESQQFLIELGESIGQSSQPSIQLIGAELRDYAIFAGENSQTLATEIGLNDPAAIDRGIQFIEKVAGDYRFGENAYSQAISLAELMERMGHRESLQPAVEKLVQSVPRVQPVKAQQTIQQIVDEFLQRWQLTGKPFRLEATNTQTGDDLSSCAGKVVVIIFCDAASQSTQTLETIGQLEYFANNGVSFVVIELENSGKPDDQKKWEMVREKLRLQFPRFIFLEAKHAAKLFDQCPVRSGPFLILLDRDHDVRATNVNPDNLRTQLENLTESS